jgi:hypothetical protein
MKVTATARRTPALDQKGVEELVELLTRAGVHAPVVEQPSHEGWFRLSLELQSVKAAREIFERDPHVAAFAVGGWIVDA